MSKKIKPHYPAPYRPGCKIVCKHVEHFRDKVGNCAIITKVNYFNPKGKLIKDHVMFVRWL